MLIPNIILYKIFHINCFVFVLHHKKPATQRPDSGRPSQDRQCECYNHASQCSLDGACINCQHFTTGRNCERCMPGYQGEPRYRTPNDCTPVRQEPTPERQCPASQFSLAKGRKSACVLCFCNGLQNVNCDPSRLYYNKIESDFLRGDDGWRVSNKQGNLTTSTSSRENGVEFTRFDDYPKQDLYLFAPAKFLGNKLASYGGELNFNIRYEGPNRAVPARLEVRLSGANVNLVYTYSKILYPYDDYQISVKLFEEPFKRYGDNARADREHLLMALSNVEILMIRASFLPDQYSVRLSNVSLDFGEETPRDRSSVRQAAAVESCQCPVGYTGTSCEVKC